MSAPPGVVLPHGVVPIERLRFGPPETWRGHHPDFGPVSLKFWPEGTPDPTGDTAAMARRAAFRHPLVAPLLAWGRGWAMHGWIEGRPLSARPSSLVPALAAADVAEALRALHRAGLLHGDLTPANVVVTGTGRAVLIDWGEISAGTPGWRLARPLRRIVGGRLDDRLALRRLRRWLR